MTIDGTPTRNVKISPTPAGHRLEIDGEDVTRGVAGLQLTIPGGGKPPELLVRTTAGKVELETEAVVVREDPDADFRAVDQFLCTVDATWLEQAMLEAPDLGKSMGVAALDALVARARTEYGHGA